MDQDKLAPHEIMQNFDPFREEKELPTSLEDFPSAIREDVEGLIYLGYLEDTFDFAGHNFVIHTLRGEEELLASLVCKEFKDTMGEPRSWIWALVSMCVSSIDGDENFCPPIGPNRREYAKARFSYCTKNWFWLTAAYIHEKYAALLVRQAEALKRVEDLYKGNRTTFTPSAGSSIDKGSSEESPEEEDVREYLDPPDITGSKID